MNKLLLVGLLLLAPVSIASADLKVAVVDLSKTFDSYYKTKDASAKIEAKKATYQKEISGAVTEFDQMQKNAKKVFDASNDPTLSAAARADKAKALEPLKMDLMNMKNKITEMETERGNEIKEEVVRRHKEIVDEISKAITEYSVPQGFDLVIDKSSASAASGVPIILYNSSKLIDITSDIVSKLNASAPVGGPAPTGAATPAAPAGR